MTTDEEREQFVMDVAGLTADGDMHNGEAFVMENDDAVETLNGLIFWARELIGDES
jgi:hypothetical protein